MITLELTEEDAEFIVYLLDKATPEDFGVFKSQGSSHSE